MSTRIDVRPEPRLVGGIWCGEVLEGLADYLDGELSVEARASVEVHLRGCNWCAEFGGRYAAVVSGLRGLLVEAEPPPSEVNERLARRLAVLEG